MMETNLASENTARRGDGHNEDAGVVQATQLVDKVSPNCPLAGVTPDPGKRRKKRRGPGSNKVWFRADLTTIETIDAVAERGGVTRSEAARQLIESALDKPRVYITPRTPPAQLETLLGAIDRWRSDLRAIKSRLNAPIADSKEDPDLARLTREWRARSQSLLHETGNIRRLLAYALNAMLDLTPDDIPLLQSARHYMKKWSDEDLAAAVADVSPKEAAVYERRGKLYAVVYNHLNSLGFDDGGG